MSRSRSILSMAIRILLGAVLLYAAWHKIAEPFAFARAMENYRVFGTALSHWIAVFIPFLEVVTAMFFIAGVWKKESAFLILILFIGFDIMILQAYFRGLNIACGCFSSNEAAPIGFWKFAENGILTVLAVVGFVVYVKENEATQVSTLKELTK